MGGERDREGGKEKKKKEERRGRGKQQTEREVGMKRIRRSRKNRSC